MSEEQGTNEGGTPEPSWWIDDNTPGQGQRPDWLNSKFKSVADLGKSYSELEKRVGTAPDTYDFSRHNWIEPDYAPFQELQDLAKSKRVPKEVMDKMLDSMDSYLNEYTVNADEEIAKLGDNAKERLTVLNNWAKSNLSSESFGALTASLRTAEGVKAIEEIRSKMMSNESTIPTGSDHGGEGPESVDAIKQEISQNLAKYKEDLKYRKEIEKRIGMAVARG